MDPINPSTTSAVNFLRVELATARACLEIAETTRDEDALVRNLQLVERTLTTVTDRLLAARDLDPAHADEFQHAVGTLSNRLTSFSLR